MRLVTFQADTWFAWRPVRLAELVRGRYQWAWLERVETRGALYFRRGVSASPLEVGRHAEEIAAGKLVVRPESR